MASSEEVGDAAPSAAPADATKAGSVQDSAQCRGASLDGGSDDASTAGRDVPEERDKVPLSLDCSWPFSTQCCVACWRQSLDALPVTSPFLWAFAPYHSPPAEHALALSVV